MNLKLGKIKKTFFYLNKVLFSASMIWIIGEYAERIDNADELLEGFLDGFKDENSQVQLQLLTAIVKLFLKKPTETPQELVTRVLTLVTQVFSISLLSLFKV
jgi:vesicle coat complex subunit